MSVNLSEGFFRVQLFCFWTTTVLKAVMKNSLSKCKTVNFLIFLHRQVKLLSHHLSLSGSLESYNILSKLSQMCFLVTSCNYKIPLHLFSPNHCILNIECLLNISTLIVILQVYYGATISLLSSSLYKGCPTYGPFHVARRAKIITSVRSSD